MPEFILAIDEAQKNATLVELPILDKELAMHAALSYKLCTTKRKHMSGKDVTNTHADGQNGKKSTLWHMHKESIGSKK